MHSRTRSLLDELYALDPNLKRDEKKLITLIENFHLTGKLIEPTKVYKDFLRSELQKSISFQKPSLFSGLKILFAPLFAGVALCGIFVFFYKDMSIRQNDTSSTNYVRPVSEEVVSQKQQTSQDTLFQESTSKTGEQKKEVVTQKVNNEEKKIPELKDKKTGTKDIQKLKTPQKPEISQKVSSPKKIPSPLPSSDDVSLLQESPQFGIDTSPTPKLENMRFSDSDLDSNVASILLFDAGKEDLIDESISASEIGGDMSSDMMSDAPAGGADMMMKSSSSFAEMAPIIFSYKISGDLNFGKEFSSWIINSDISLQDEIFILKEDDISQVPSGGDEQIITLTIKLESDPIEKERERDGKKQKIKLYKGIIETPPISYTGPQIIYFLAE